MGQYISVNRASRWAATTAAICIGGICLLPVALTLTQPLIADGLPSLTLWREVYADFHRLALLGRNSAIVTVGSVTLALVLGAPAGFLCFRTDLPGRRLVVGAALLAAGLPTFVHTAAWVSAFGMPALTTRVAAVWWIQGIAYAPLALLITGICFARGSAELEDLARLDASPAQVVMRVSLPQGAWGMAAAGLCIAVLTLSDITVTDILMVRTFAEETFTQFQLGAGAGRAALVSYPVIACLAALGLVVWRLFARYAAAPPPTRPAPGLHLGRIRRWLWLIPTAATVTAFALLPVGALLVALRRPGNLLEAARTAGAELAYTLVLTPIAATVTTALALVATWCLVRHRRWRWLAAAVTALLLAVPGPVVAVGIATVLNRPGVAGWIYDSPLVVIYAYVLRALPYAVLSLLPALQALPAELEDLAAVEGASWLGRICRVVVPMCWRGLMISWCVSFVVAVGDVGASFLVIPPGGATLTVRFYTLIHYGVYPTVAGMCLILLFCAMLPAALVAALLWRTLQRRFF